MAIRGQQLKHQSNSSIQLSSLAFPPPPLYNQMCGSQESIIVILDLMGNIILMRKFINHRGIFVPQSGLSLTLRSPPKSCGWLPNKVSFVYFRRCLSSHKEKLHTLHLSVTPQIIFIKSNIPPVVIVIQITSASTRLWEPSESLLNSKLFSMTDTF
jgi:hypothetical protein